MKNATLQVMVFSLLLVAACSSSPDVPVTPDPAVAASAAPAPAPEATSADTSAAPGETAPVDPFAESSTSEPVVEEPVTKSKTTVQQSKTTKTTTIPGVLEEVTDAEQMAGAGAQAGGLAATPAYEKLRVRLNELGYEGVGLEHEPATVLNLLTSVFSSPEAAKRKIKRVYTGGAMEYDARAQAITIGGTTNKAKILTFLKKKVPKR